MRTGLPPEADIGAELSDDDKVLSQYSGAEQVLQEGKTP